MRPCQITGVGSVSERGRAPAARKAPSSRPHAARDAIVGVASAPAAREAPSCDAIAGAAATPKSSKLGRSKLNGVASSLYDGSFAAEDARLRPQLLALVHRPQLLVFVGGSAS